MPRSGSTRARATTSRRCYAGLQEIYTHDEKREQLFALLEESLTSKTRHTTGRPGMQLWRIFVLATLKQGLNCDFDRLQQYANHHDTVRQMLGHGDWDDDTKYPMQTLVDNISLLSAEKLAEISQLVVEHGHEWVKKSPGDALRGRCDSFVVETDVHYPTDFNLLWDAMRVLVRVMVRACKEYGLPGWRQQALHLREVRRLFHRVRGRRRQDREERCRAYLDKALSIINKAEQCYEEIRRFGACTSIEQALADARRQAAQIERPCIARRDDSTPRKGVLALRASYSLECQGQGGCFGRAGGSGVRARRPVSIRTASSGPVEGK